MEISTNKQNKLNVFEFESGLYAYGLYAYG